MIPPKKTPRKTGQACNRGLPGRRHRHCRVLISTWQLLELCINIDRNIYNLAGIGVIHDSNYMWCFLFFHIYRQSWAMYYWTSFDFFSWLIILPWPNCSCSGQHQYDTSRRSRILGPCRTSGRSTSSTCDFSNARQLHLHDNTCIHKSHTFSWTECFLVLSSKCTNIYTYLSR